jgi:hypothetical protein
MWTDALDQGTRPGRHPVDDCGGELLRLVDVHRVGHVGKIDDLEWLSGGGDQRACPADLPV